MGILETFLLECLTVLLECIDISDTAEELLPFSKLGMLLHPNCLPSAAYVYLSNKLAITKYYIFDKPSSYLDKHRTEKKGGGYLPQISYPGSATVICPTLRWFLTTSLKLNLISPLFSYQARNSLSLL